MALEQITAPEYWANYLINGDPSNLTLAEQARADNWMASNGVVAVVDCSNSRFTWHYRLYDPLADCAGGDVQDYTCQVA